MGGVYAIHPYSFVDRRNGYLLHETETGLMNQAPTFPLQLKFISYI